MTPGRAAPDAVLAAEIATAVTGEPPLRVTRFTTGAMHYVFEATFTDRPAAVVRIAAEYGAAAMQGAVALSQKLRPLGVPLPELLAADLSAEFPWMVLERLPGADLGEVIAGLGSSHRDAIAAEVAGAQAIVTALPSASRYGYAVAPAAAPHDRWSHVVADSLARSRNRIIGAGLFDSAVAIRLMALLDAARDELDAVPPTPFLHDTTTKNVIVTADGRFSGIVDVDDLCFGDPRYAVALTAASLLNMGVGTEYTECWLRHAGLSGDRLFRLYVALFLLDFMSEHGQLFNGNARPSSPEGHARLQQLFDDALRDAADA